ncbi:MAG: hypothetical protein LWW96_05075 [Acidovorax sp.]|uniref:hypothetical protein n=1 Tax=Acidovorax sp. TaxID=1872122 RepID=UPI0025BAA213|nr:hypothetical protein [Acidovorax sp.]MCE1191508.1 hypothetical protein [Acidovorax sp.]
MTHIAAFLLLGGLVATALWLPFGFEMGGLIEEWGMLGLYSKYGHFFVTGRDGVVPNFAMRPLTFLMPGIANKLSSHSFVPWHLLLIVALMLKGAVGGWLVLRLSHSRLLGAMAVLLFIVYPADTMHVSLRSLHIVWAITFVMLGACALIVALEKEGDGFAAYIAAALASVLVVVGIAMYEASFAMLLLAPGYFVVKLGARGVIRIAWQRARIWVVFGAGLGLYGLYLAGASATGSSYQGSLVGGGGIVGLLTETLPKLFTVGAVHVFWGGWAESFRLTLEQPVSNLIYLVVCTMVLVVAAVLTVRVPRKQPFDEVSSTSACRLMWVGVVIALAGYFPYLFSLPHLSISQRTFLAASPGAALVWVGALAFIVGRSRVLALLVSSAAVLLGLTFQLHQFSHYQYLSDLQRKLLGEVVSQYGQREGSPPLVVRDYSNLLGHTWMFLPENLGYALSYIVGRPTGPVEICRQPSGEWMRRDGLGRTGHCYQLDGQWVFEEAEPVGALGRPVPGGSHKVIRWPVATAVTLDVGQDMLTIDGEELTARRGGISRDQNVPVDPTGLYGTRWPLAGKLWQSSYRVRDCYRWDFGDVWSLELPIRGNGWREAEWTVSGLDKTSAAWKTSRAGSLFFELLPRDTDYILRFRLSAAANDRVLKSLIVSVNGKQMSLALSGLEGVATVPVGVLKRGENVLMFESEVAKDYYGLSIMLDRVMLEPRSSNLLPESAVTSSGC